MKTLRHFLNLRNKNAFARVDFSDLEGSPGIIITITADLVIDPMRWNDCLDEVQKLLRFQKSYEPVSEETATGT